MHNRIFNELPRTNSNLEGWHTRFSTIFRQTHPSVWEFIDTLKLDAHNRILIAQMLAGAAPSPQKRVYHDVNARIATLVQGYNNGNIAFLRVFLII